VKGPRPLPVRVINAYVNRVLIAAQRDPAVAEQFMRVVALQAPSKRVFRPSTALRVLLGNLRHSRVPGMGAATRAAVHSIGATSGRPYPRAPSGQARSASGESGR
jgi:hypothetical protein